jgi:hypothetical protein
MTIDYDGNVGIGTTTPSYPLTVAKNVSNISIYSQAQISATGYITRTEVYDKSQGDALNFIKDTSAYKIGNEINHSAFEYSKVIYDKQVIDRVYNETYIENECKEIIIKEATDGKYAETKQECNDVEKIRVVTTYKTIQEEGVSLDKEVALLKQAVYELKMQNEYLQQQINNLTGQDIVLNEINDIQNEAICSIKIFDWCIIK